MWRGRILIIMFAALSACGPYPRDVEGTTDRVRTDGIVRVGIVAGDGDPHHRAAIVAYLARLGRAAGARPRLTTGAAEPLLASLDHGELDLVVGEFAKDTPWLTDVTVIDPLAERIQGDRAIHLMPVARNGENRWIMLLEKTARDARGR